MARTSTKPRAPNVPRTIESADIDQYPVVFGEHPDAEQEYEETPEDKLLALVSEQIGGDGDSEGSVTLFKFNDEKKREWVERMSASDFEASGIPMIAKRHGGGEYEIYVYGANKKIVARQRITISKTATPLRETGSGSVMSPEVLTLIEAQKRTETMLQQLAGAVVNSRGASFEPQSPGQSRSEWLQELLTLRQLFGAPNGGAATNPVEMFRGLAEVFKEMQPSDGEPSLIDQVSKFAERFGPMIQQAMQSQPGTTGLMLPSGAVPHAPGVPPNAVRQPQPRPQPQTQPQSGEQNAMFFQQQMMKWYLQQFIDTAASNGDPYPWAAIVVEKVPEPMLRAWLAKPSLAQELATIDPRVLQFQTWFTELQGAIGEILDAPVEEGETGDDSGPELTGASMGIPGVPGASQS